ncbi:MAG: hypothetical protein L0Y71_11145 [Gemmataceae bacterium]|nr:hypothetical protein [Gemmataceae bacterium]
MSDLKARIRRWSKRIAIVLAVFGLPIVAFYYYAAWQGERELRAVLAELDANETPWRWDDLLAASGKVAAADDVRAIVLSVHAQLPRGFAVKVATSGKDLRPNLLMWPEEAESYSNEVASLEAALTEARQVARMPKGRLQVPWGTDLLGPSPDDVQKARMFAHVLHIDACRQAHHGDLERALEDCLAIQRISQALEEEFGMMTQLVRIALQAISLTCLERVLGHGQPPPEQLERVQNAWEQFDRERALANALRGERAFLHWLFERIAERKVAIQDIFPLPNSGLQQAFTDIYLRTNLKQSHAWSLRHFTEALKTLDLPEPERAARLRQLDDDIRKAPPAAKMLTPAWAKTFDAHQRTEARTRCAITALACERFRRVHERWPQAPAELCPEFLTKVPLDPCTGQALQLRATRDGIVVYSAGPDRKLRGTYYDDASPDARHSSYEFRLWNVNQRRLVDHRQP